MNLYPVTNHVQIIAIRSTRENINSQPELSNLNLLKLKVSDPSERNTDFKYNSALVHSVLDPIEPQTYNEMTKCISIFLRDMAISLLMGLSETVHHFARGSF
jgi:hypothetical protein